MNQKMIERYAHLLVHYCMAVKPGDKVYLASTILAEPLVREVYRAALDAGALLVDYDLAIQNRDQLFMQFASDEALRQPNSLQKTAFETYDCYLHIRAPYELMEAQPVALERQKVRAEVMAEIQRTYFERTANRSLRRNLCQYPTEASAREAGMPLDEYAEFVFNACKLSHEDPISAWLQVRNGQQHIVDFLNQCEQIRYVTEGTDITFSTRGRVWINSDGQTNMPSGEVYTSPEENSVNGTVYFSYPGIYQGNLCEEVRLWVTDGYIERWDAKIGKDFLDYIFSLPGARRFGEAAIGTNYDINRMTRNILFDEKIGGTIHMAIGQSYPQAGGKNESSVHWDMITDMTQGGEIWADGQLIYKNGRFLEFGLKS